MTRRWTVIPGAKDIPGAAANTFAYSRKNPVEGSWLYADSLPSNQSGWPFGLINGELDGVYVASVDLVAYDIEVWYHFGLEIGAVLLSTVSIPNTDRTVEFDSVDLGLVLIPTPPTVQLACKLVNVATAPPSDLRVILRPIGDAP